MQLILSGRTSSDSKQHTQLVQWNNRQEKYNINIAPLIYLNLFCILHEIIIYAMNGFDLKFRIRPHNAAVLFSFDKTVKTVLYAFETIQSECFLFFTHCIVMCTSHQPHLYPGIKTRSLITQISRTGVLWNSLCRVRGFGLQFSSG